MLSQSVAYIQVSSCNVIKNKAQWKLTFWVVIAQIYERIYYRYIVLGTSSRKHKDFHFSMLFLCCHICFVLCVRHWLNLFPHVYSRTHSNIKLFTNFVVFHWSVFSPSVMVSCERISSSPALATEDEHQTARGHLNQKLLAECWGYGIENIWCLGHSKCFWHCSGKRPTSQWDEHCLPQGEARGSKQTRRRPQKVRWEDIYCESKCFFSFTDFLPCLEHHRNDWEITRGFSSIYSAQTNVRAYFFLCIR